ncbi:hypothetical protein CRENBAI_019342 [Crenichthys baileyi]|uniref:Uncharacterized protein n=1 Tax=Crenichthys baileyi TaxID=28760 RepID=A0AAV9SP93_9TELE
MWLSSSRNQVLPPCIVLDLKSRRRMQLKTNFRSLFHSWQFKAPHYQHSSKKPVYPPTLSSSSLLLSTPSPSGYPLQTTHPPWHSSSIPTMALLTCSLRIPMDQDYQFILLCFNKLQLLNF